MWVLFNHLLATTQFMPHGSCYLWKPNLIGLHVISDALIAFAYFSIPFTLLYFISKRPDIPFNSVFVLFALFIVACGSGHILDIWTLWYPHYWLSGYVRAITAFISVITAVALIILLPQALSLPSPAQMQTTNDKLKAEIKERKQAENQLRKALKILNFHVENSPLAVVEWDKNFRVKRWSKRAKEIFGWEAEETLDKYPTDWEIIVPEDVEKVAQIMSDLIKGNQPHNLCRNRNYTKDGKIIFCEWYNSALLDESGDLVSIFSLVLDVTEKEKAIQELRNQEEKLRAIIQNMPVMMNAFDAESNIIVWNRECEKVTGYSATEVIGNPEAMTKLYPNSEYLATMKQKWSERGNNYRDWEWEITCKDGTIKTVAWSNISEQFPIPGWENWGTGIDITEREQAKTLLEQEKQSLQAILNNAPIWIWRTNLSGKMLFINKTFCDNVGVPEARFLLANHYKDVLGEEESANCLASDAACLAKDEIHVSEEYLPFVDGKMHYLEVLKAQIKDSGGETIGIIGLAVDITDRKEAQQKLKLSEVRYRKIADKEKLLNSVINQIRQSLELDAVLQTTVNYAQGLLQLDACLFIWYRQENEQYFWEVVNQAKKRILPNYLGKFVIPKLDFDPENIDQKAIMTIEDLATLSNLESRDLFASQDYEKNLLLPLATRSGKIGFIMGISVNEERNWQDSEIELLQALSTTVAIAIDQAELYHESCENAHKAEIKATELQETLHELQRTQAQLIQSEKMSSLGQMVAGVAHEINNPVNFIYGNISHTLEYCQDLLDLLELYANHYPEPGAKIQQLREEIDCDFIKEDLPKLLDSMKMGANRIRKIVLSLRNFSRIDEADIKAVDIHEGIDNSLLILQNRFKKNLGNSQIEVKKEYGNLPLVECYPGELNQVFMNLLSNAIDALEETFAQSRVLLTSSQPSYLTSSATQPTITIRTAVIDSWAIASISDNGKGMSPEVGAKLFDPFFTTKPVGKGTGLGLSISYQIIVEHHGGDLQCISQPGKGAEFLVKIPLKQPRKAGV
ncbi:MAG: PAS domain S-box protein [Oscillatoria sp. PMC 1068.18]|nr:PAS domain S-box protein [Oscillatoria sp. PMC 1076.18]MEC4988416.1 PAS domain S-box protein [Oscillatoria sp. PMC 1068.18]